MRCSNCGHENVAEASFCGQCGSKLQAATEEVKSNIITSVETDNEQQGKVVNVRPDVFGQLLDDRMGQQQGVISPFGQEYGSRIDPNAQYQQMHKQMLAQQYYNPYAGGSATHPQRRSWSQFVFVTTLIMSILLFASGAITLSGVVRFEVEESLWVVMPDTFGTFRGLEITIGVVALLLSGILFGICLLSRQMKMLGIQNRDNGMRKNRNKAILVLCIIVLVLSLISLSLSIFREFVRRELIVQLTNDGVIYNWSDLLGGVTEDIVVSIMTIAIGYLIQIALIVACICFTVGVARFLRVKE